MTADQNTITETISQFVTQTFARARSAQFSPSLHLVNKGIVDSMGLLSIIMFLEEQFDIMVCDDEVVDSNFGCVESIASFVYNKTKNAGIAS